MKTASFTKSEQEILDIVDGNRPRKFKHLKRHDKAIVALKEAGIIIKGPDNILRRKEVIPESPFTRQELAFLKRALYSHKVSKLTTPDNNEIWAEASELERKIEILIRSI